MNISESFLYQIGQKWMCGNIFYMKISLPSLYFSHKRQVVNRDGVLLAKCEYITLNKNEQWEEMDIRCRTIGDMTCTGVSISEADSLEKIIEEKLHLQELQSVGEELTIKDQKLLWKIEKGGYF